ncbi:MAG: hypothetical protein R3E97_09415 [Candidatus Eisenbacteria bacterium]
MIRSRQLPSVVSAAAFSAALAFAAVGPSLAGPNANGTLIIHAVPGLAYCDFGTPCEQTDAYGPATCEEAISNLDADAIFLWSVYAAFAPTDSPRLSGVTFGVDYDDESVVLLDFSACGDFELPTGAWPQPGAGTAVTWSVTQTSPLTHVYAFVGYNYSFYGEDVSFDLVPHPSQGGFFADDDVPSNLDPIVDYGKLGFGNNPGYLPCPSGPVPGACCLPDCGPCVVMLDEECLQVGGLFMGQGTVCDPNPCDCPPFGACCLSDGSCDLGTEAECMNQGGDWMGEGTTCDPDPCPPVPVLESTWGRIKGTYR